MCFDPLTIGLITGGVTALSQGASLMGQQAQADAQNQYARAQRQEAVRAAGEEQAQLNRRQIQEEQAATEQRIQEGSQYRQAAATASLRAMESGLAGTGVEVLLGDLEAVYGRNLATIDRSLTNTTDQFQVQRQGINAQAIARGTYQRAEGPTLLDYGLAIGKSAVSGYDAYYRYKPKE